MISSCCFIIISSFPSFCPVLNHDWKAPSFSILTHFIILCISYHKKNHNTSFLSHEMLNWTNDFIQGVWLIVLSRFISDLSYKITRTPVNILIFNAHYVFKHARGFLRCFFFLSCCHAAKRLKAHLHFASGFFYSQLRIHSSKICWLKSFRNLSMVS